ncbi:MAG: multicopper oxidase domain-containing protein [Planctomycetes bacterium]|nr:multicopper oxidase domain-containing protein [Planctomycetota bacterium]
MQFPEELMRPPGVDGAPLATPPAWRVPGAPEEMAGRTIEQQQLLRQMPISEIAFPRYEPGRIYSPPPPLMGAQMGRVHTLNVPPLGYELDGDVKVFHLIAQPVWRELTDGDASHLKLPQIERNIVGGAGKWITHDQVPRYMLAWGYNGSVPGPTIEVTQGDRVRIVLKNELPEPTSIHWHGAEIPNSQDGPSPEVHPPVMPGETHEYEFTFYQTGTLLYHSGFNVVKQDFMGLGGMLVIHPLEPRSTVDKDFIILHQEWRLRPNNPHPDIWGGPFNWITFNAKVAPSIEVMTVRQGDRVRIRQGNLSMTSHPIHLHGYTFRIVGTTGGPTPESAQMPRVTVSVEPGSTEDIEFVAWNPGIWRFHCHKLHHIVNDVTFMPRGLMPHGGMFTYLHVLPREDGLPWRHPDQARVEALKQRMQQEGGK